VPSCALLLAAALAVLGPVGSATASDAGRVVTGQVAEQVSEQVSEQSLRVPVKAEAGGAAVDLDVSIFTGREATGRRPAVVLAHGFGGSKRDLPPGRAPSPGGDTWRWRSPPAGSAGRAA
jgi:ABC-2 type transport system ATP-binding protein